jgi:hypothetical protein
MEQEKPMQANNNELIDTLIRQCPNLIWIDEKQVSEITGRAIQTLRNDRFHGRGIRYYKIGRSVRYKLTDVSSFMEKGAVEIT